MPLPCRGYAGTLGCQVDYWQTDAIAKLGAITLVLSQKKRKKKKKEIYAFLFEKPHRSGKHTIHAVVNMGMGTIKR
ncbi:hypothetical protein POVWA2_001310 [Plasmodium ovale wallikeri]|uniref:Uncharacterized protein n=1 Tax=Plasmodium ovale wallikeri TaxID=864142 RepID=A0A1A8YH75_PLAOA|nr:hypothetical protein POVWA2_001310 [Plasmodium ovale wallikeri]SBT33310.1 hypothetical protein POVWA1_016460 [Plasmodium ovale wallikeri]